MPVVLPQRSSSVGGKLNVYTGLIPPSAYEGIWIKTDGKVDRIINDNDVWIPNSWSRVDGTYYTELSSSNNLRIEGKYSRMTTGFNDLYYSYNGDIYPSKPIYYGNGTEWIKIKG